VENWWGVAVLVVIGVALIALARPFPKSAKKAQIKKLKGEFFGGAASIAMLTRDPRKIVRRRIVS